MRISQRGQTSLEYILLMAGAIMFVVVLIILSRSNVLTPSGSKVENSSQSVQNVIASIQTKQPSILNPATSVTVSACPINFLTITWMTDVPATSVISYKRSTLSNWAFNSSTKLELSHSLTMRFIAGAVFTYDYTLTSCSSPTFCNGTTGTFESLC